MSKLHSHNYYPGDMLAKPRAVLLYAHTKVVHIYCTCIAQVSNYWHTSIIGKICINYWHHDIQGFTKVSQVIDASCPTSCAESDPLDLTFTVYGKPLNTYVWYLCLPLFVCISISLYILTLTK